MRTPTVYKELNNRCPRCGHRLDQRAAIGNRCSVRTAAYDDAGHIIPDQEVRCNCGQHRRP